MRIRRGSLSTNTMGAWCPSLGASGTRLVDRSVYRRDATLNNSPTYLADTGKLSLSYNGSTQFCNASVDLSALISTKVFTFSTWIKTSATNSNAYPFAAGNTASDTPYLGFRLDPTGNGQTQFFYRDGAGNFVIPGSGAAVNNGQWNQLLAVANGSTLQVFVNGSAYGSASSISSLGASTINRVTIGALGRTTVIVHFNGQIDDSRIFNRALTAAEVRQFWIGGRGFGLIPKRQRRRGTVAAAATNRRRRILCGDYS